jgi:hypothetical protein
LINHTFTACIYKRDDGRTTSAVAKAGTRA